MYLKKNSGAVRMRDIQHVLQKVWLTFKNKNYWAKIFFVLRGQPVDLYIASQM